MSTKFKIAIAGIGGVGGFYGGKLAAFYEQHDDVEINFIARGPHLAKIKTEGLTLITETGIIVSHPKNITKDPEDLGHLDLIVFCCKAYDLEDLAKRFSKNISDKTFLLPLLNGVDNTERLQKLFPLSKSLHGCVYIFSNIQSPGVIKVNTSYDNLLFGNHEANSSDLKKIEKIFTDAGINCSVYEDMRSKIWEKFAFISPLASITSASNLPIGQILEDENYKSILLSLMNEVVEVSKHQQVNLPSDIIENHLERMRKLPYNTTSSMQIDYANNKQTEMENLTGFIVTKANEANIDVPAYQNIYQRLKKIK